MTTLMGALGDENRLRILNLLLQADELCVCDIERVLDIPQARVSRHLTILRNSGWVASRRDGRWMHYRLISDTPLKKELVSSFRKHWNDVPEFGKDLLRLAHPLNSCCVPVKETES
jgi:ArsR family transcriptional regulator, arsenate/arsenite/antimonite-responsive transcriptional repressor